MVVRTADCQTQESKFESRMAQACIVRRVRIRPESGARGWQSTVHLKAVCQAVIIIVANRGIGSRELAIESNPDPAILHRETPVIYY
jgi:hypothetical protein